MKEPIERWPISQTGESEVPDRIGVEITCMVSYSEKREWCQVEVGRFSKYNKLLRVMARIIASRNQKSLLAISHKPMPALIEEAELYLIKTEQISLGTDWEMKYKRLGPSMENGVIFVGERIATWL